MGLLLFVGFWALEKFWGLVAGESEDGKEAKLPIPDSGCSRLIGRLHLHEDGFRRHADRLQGLGDFEMAMIGR